MSEVDSLSDVLQSANVGKRYPAIKLVKDNPELAATISKLVRPRETSNIDIDKPNSFNTIHQSQMEKISEGIKQNITDSENIVQLFPDIELSMQILVSSILSPKDMNNSNLIYRVEDSVLTHDLTMKINDVIKTHMNSYYKLEDKLNDMLREALFTKGSYIEVCMPESVVDHVINFKGKVSTESLSELFDNESVAHLGILGNSGTNKNKPTLESMFNGQVTETFVPYIRTDDDKLNTALESVIDITDNYKLLKLPRVLNSVTKSKITDIVRKDVRASLESEKLDLSNQKLSDTLYKNNPRRPEQFLNIPTAKSVTRKSIGRPLVMKLPSESTIPVYMAGDETRHVGYFLMIDLEGNPITVDSNSMCGNNLGSLLNQSAKGDSNALGSMLINKAKSNLVGKTRMPTVDQISDVYSSIVEKDLLERMRNGVYKSDVVISNNQDLYRIMLARALSGYFTRIVYVPSELVSYLAFKYYNNGVGKSYLDDVKILTSLRAMMLFSKVMALTKSAINLTHVNMTLDPNDPDPEKSIELAVHEVAKTRQQYFPLGINTPVDLVDWIHKAGFEFSFEGHPALPETKFEFETKNIQRDVPDSDLDELLREQTYMAFGLNSETVDGATGADFATTVASNNLLLAKRVRQLQERFGKFLSELTQKVVLSDPIILKELIEVVTENSESIEKTLPEEEVVIYKENPELYIETLIEEHVSNLDIDLPKPDTISLETQSESFDAYTDSLDKALDAWINEDSIDLDIAGDISGNVPAIRSIVKNYYLRKWMSNNGFLTELADITTTDEEGNASLDLFTISKDHMEGVVRSSLHLIDEMNKVKKASDQDLANMNAEPVDESADETGDETGGDDNLDDGGFDF